MHGSITSIMWASVCWYWHNIYWICLQLSLSAYSRLIHWCAFGGDDDTHSVPLWESASSLVSRRRLLSCCRFLLLYRQR